jgi:hypothetical protein
MRLLEILLLLLLFMLPYKMQFPILDEGKKVVKSFTDEEVRIFFE